MYCSKERERSNSFYNTCEYIEELRKMMEAGTINSYKAVQMLDKKMDQAGRFRDYYEENRIKIINRLFY